MELTNTENRALNLLGTGIAPEQVAAALGLSPSRISQLLSDAEFAEKVATLRYENLSKHNARDASYDALEDDLLERMKNCLPMMYKPNEILNAIRIINAAKRRGQSAPESITQQHTHITLTMPVSIVQKFQTNINNQVVAVSGQELLTIQSSELLKQVVPKKPEELTNVQPTQTTKGLTRGNSQLQVTDL
jgi:hypothetical protein